MSKPKPTLKSNNQGLFATLRQVRESDNGVITYHFEEKKSFNDYSKHDNSNKPNKRGSRGNSRGRGYRNNNDQY